MNILCTYDLKKYYENGQVTTKAVDGVSLEIRCGEFVSVVGPSGSGKTTLLHLIGGLDYPTSGDVEIDGTNIFELNDEELTVFRRRN